jgi:NTP pyrophosphatase (non-canonical NTP hydrolase)
MEAVVENIPVQQEIFKADAAQIFREALAELRRAKKKHPSWPVHIVARAGIVCEEAGELIRAALNHKYESNGKIDEAKWKNEMEKEAIQVIATAIRFIENLRK